MQRCFGLLSVEKIILQSSSWVSCSLKSHVVWFRLQALKPAAECYDYELNRSMNVMWDDSKVESDLHCSI